MGDDPTLTPAFAVGDRVVMLRHADWKNDALATVKSPGRPRRSSAGTLYIDYWVESDELQADLTDEMHGDLDRRYRASTAAEQFLRRTDETVTD